MVSSGWFCFPGIREVWKDFPYLFSFLLLYLRYDTEFRYRWNRLNQLGRTIELIQSSLALGVLLSWSYRIFHFYSGNTKITEIEASPICNQGGKLERWKKQSKINSLILCAFVVKLFFVHPKDPKILWSCPRIGICEKMEIFLTNEGVVDFCRSIGAKTRKYK